MPNFVELPPSTCDAMLSEPFHVVIGCALKEARKIFNAHSDAPVARLCNDIPPSEFASAIGIERLRAAATKRTIAWTNNPYVLDHLAPHEVSHVTVDTDFWITAVNLVTLPGIEDDLKTFSLGEIWAQRFLPPQLPRPA